MASAVRRFASGLTKIYRYPKPSYCIQYLGAGRPVSTEALPTLEHAETTTLKISETCVQHLKKLGKLNTHLRVIVEGGGCSGFQYKFELDSEVNDDDKVIEKDGVGIVVDCDSLEFLKGSTIDFHEELIRSSFRVVGNPQAEQGCSCGVSFSLK